METIKYLYPNFSMLTHEITRDTNAIKEVSVYQTLRVYETLKKDTRVCMIREFLYMQDNFYSLVKLVDSDDYYYVLDDALKNIGNKQEIKKKYENGTFISPGNGFGNLVNISQQTAGVAYEDKYNGRYCVRIAVDYDTLLDMGVFSTALKNAYYDGINRIFQKFYPNLEGIYDLEKNNINYISNNIIDELQETYYTFAYVDKDQHLTTNSSCDAITFTVSIPFIFFNNFSTRAISPPQPPPVATKTLTFTRETFYNDLSALAQYITILDSHVKKALYPNKLAKGYVTEIEIDSINKFVSEFEKFTESVGHPIASSDNTKKYTLEFFEAERNSGHYLSIKRINIIAQSGPVYLNNNMDALNNEKFAISRILNYLHNANQIYNWIAQNTKEKNEYNIEDFFNQFVNYPKVNIEESGLKLGGVNYTAEQVKNFRLFNARKSESCLNISDVVNGYASSADLIKTLPGYAHFSRNDPELEPADGPTIVQQMRLNRDSINNVRGDLGTSSGLTFDVQNEIVDLVENYKERPLRAIANTLGYITSRLDLQQIIIKYIICLMRGADESDSRIAEILNNLPQQVVDYFYYLDNIQSIDGAAWADAAIRGLPFDQSLVCGDEIAYYMKYVRKFLRSFDALTSSINRTVEFVHNEDRFVRDPSLMSNRQVTDPWKSLTKSMADTFWKVLLDFTFDVFRDILSVECPPDIAAKAAARDLASVFNTHHRNADGNNKNQEELDSNRWGSLTNIDPGITKQTGLGYEYTVSIMQSFLDRVKCIIATPQDFKGLKEGIISPENRIAIENLIDLKYSDTALLTLKGTGKLEHFFKTLFGTLDPQTVQDVINNIPAEISNKLCDPEVKSARDDLIARKFPPNLDLINLGNRTITQKVLDAVEKAKKGNNIISYKALCPDKDTADSLQAKNDIIAQQKATVRSIFSDVLETFNNESLRIPDAFKENRELLRGSLSDNSFDSIEYAGYQTNLYKNLADNQNFLYENLGLNFAKYTLKDKELDINSLARFYLAEEKTLQDDSECFLDYAGSEDTVNKEKLNKLLQQGKVVIVTAPITEDFDLDPKNSKSLFYNSYGVEGLEKRRKKVLKDIKDNGNDLLDYWWHHITANLFAHKLAGNDLTGHVLNRNQPDTTDDEVDDDDGGLDAKYGRVEGKKYTVKEYYKSVPNESLMYTSNFSRAISPEMEKYIQSKGDVVLVFVRTTDSFGPDPIPTVAIRHVFWDKERYDYRINDLGDFRGESDSYYSFNLEKIKDMFMKGVLDQYHIPIQGSGSFYTSYDNINNNIERLKYYYLSKDNKPEGLELPMSPHNWLRDVDWSDGEVNKCLKKMNENVSNVVATKMSENSYEVYRNNKNFFHAIESQNYKTQAMHDFSDDKEEESELLERDGGEDRYVILNKDLFERPEFNRISSNDEYTYFYKKLYNCIPKIEESQGKKQEFNKILEQAQAFNETGLFSISYDNRNKTASVIVPRLSRTSDSNPQTKVTPSTYYSFKFTESLSGWRYEGESYKSLSMNNSEENLSFIKLIPEKAGSYYFKPSHEDGEIKLIKDNSKENGFWKSLGKGIVTAVTFGLATLDAEEQEITKNAEEVNQKLQFEDWKKLPTAHTSECSKNYSNLTKFYFRNPDYLGCNYNAHYLNLEHYLDIAARDAVKKICDDNIAAAFGDIIDRCLVYMTTRAYVTDYLIKCIPILSIMRRNQISNLYNDQVLIDVIINHMKKEMNEHTADLKEDDQKQYFYAFCEKASKVYDEEISAKQPSKNEVLWNYDRAARDIYLNKILSFFIKKQILYFLSYCREKKVFVENDITNINSAFLFPYFLMHSKVDVKINNIFSGTKTELAKIFFKTSHISSGQESQNNEYAKISEETDKLLQTIMDVAYSHNPASIISMKSNIRYKKYLIFAFNAMVDNARQIFLNSARAQDPALRMSRTINFAMAGALGAAINFWDEKEMTDYINNYIKNTDFNKDGLRTAYLLSLKRTMAGKSPVYDAAMYAIVATSLRTFGTTSGWMYCALDTIKEGMWTQQVLGEMRATKEVLNALKDPTNPCAPIQVDRTQFCKQLQSSQSAKEDESGVLNAVKEDIKTTNKGIEYKEEYSKNLYT